VQAQAPRRMACRASGKHLSTVRVLSRRYLQVVLSLGTILLLLLLCHGPDPSAAKRKCFKSNSISSALLLLLLYRALPWSRSLSVLAPFPARFAPFAALLLTGIAPFAALAWCRSLREGEQRQGKVGCQSEGCWRQGAWSQRQRGACAASSKSTPGQIISSRPCSLSFARRDIQRGGERESERARERAREGETHREIGTERERERESWHKTEARVSGPCLFSLRSLPVWHRWTSMDKQRRNEQKRKQAPTLTVHKPLA
jgi:hypothetical protein